MHLQQTQQPSDRQQQQQKETQRQKKEKEVMKYIKSI